MVYWTIQKRDIIEKVLRGEEYYPDFSKSDFIAKNVDLSKLYNHLLYSYNFQNSTQLEGVIFTFMYGDRNAIYSLREFTDFEYIIRQSYDSVKSLWKHFLKSDTVIVKMEIEQDFNPIYIDMNDFQFLMPPIILVPPYRREHILSLLDDIENGIIRPSVFPSNIIQAHIPCIKKEYIAEVHNMFIV